MSSDEIIIDDDTDTDGDDVAELYHEMLKIQLDFKDLCESLQEFEDGTEIYHYTTADALEKILSYKRVCLWMSRIDWLNDKKELVHIQEIYQKVCDNLVSDKEINEDYFSLIRDIKPSEEAMIGYRYKSNEGEGSDESNTPIKYKEMPCKRYVCSFSKNEDSLPMWNYYSKGQRYEGFNIGFDMADFLPALRADFGKGFNYSLSPVFYSKEKYNYLKNVVKWLYERYMGKNKADLIGLLSDALTGVYFKEECFSHENEVRIVLTVPDKLPDDATDNNKKFCIKYRNHSGFLIPYLEYCFPCNVITSVMIGPLTGSQDASEKQVKVIKEMLQLRGYGEKEVDYSKIPIRF